MKEEPPPPPPKKEEAKGAGLEFWEEMEVQRVKFLVRTRRALTQGDPPNNTGQSSGIAAPTPLLSSGHLHDFHSSPPSRPGVEEAKAVFTGAGSLVLNNLWF